MNVVRSGLTLIVLLLSTNLVLADEILGTWLRDNGEEQVEFATCGEVSCGNIVWLKPGSHLNAKSGNACSSTCDPMEPIPGPARPPAPIRDQSIQAECLSKDPPLRPLAVSPVA
jgi:hypothetical protein